MKFKAEPNYYVRLSNKYVQRATGLKGFYFDDKGIYETENETMIKVLSQNFEQVEENKSETKNEFNCKKCNFTTDNKGFLMAHYRKDHPKGAKK